MGLSAARPAETSLQLYVGFRLLHSTIVYKSLMRELSAIRAYAFSKGNTYEEYKHMPFLQRSLTGFKKERNHSFKKQPFTRSDIIAFLRHCRHRDHNSRLVSALVQFGFCALARVSEYAVKTQRDRFNARTLRMSNLKFHPSRANPTSITIKLFGSKMNQFGEEEHLVLRCACDTGVCGFCALLEYIAQRRNLYASSYLFQWEDGRVVSQDHVRKTIKTMCAAEGMDESLYSSHSLRSGGATALAAMGVPTELIQRLGRWSPASFTLQTVYLKPNATNTAALISRARRGRAPTW
jgi:integrase